MPTYSPKPGEITRAWHVIDATDVVLGRLASQAATLLRGKHKPTYAPHMDTGDFVIIVNAEKIAVAQSKRDNEFVYRHSGYPGGLRKRSVGEMIEKHPDRLVEKAVKGMLPKNRLGRAMGKKLKVYAGPAHPHTLATQLEYGVAAKFIGESRRSAELIEEVCRLLPPEVGRKNDLYVRAQFARGLLPFVPPWALSGMQTLERRLKRFRRER